MADLLAEADRLRDQSRQLAERTSEIGGRVAARLSDLDVLAEEAAAVLADAVRLLADAGRRRG